MTRVAVIGAGRFGREHLAVYDGLLDAELIGALDPDQARARFAAKTYDITAFPDLDALLAAAPDAVSLVVPAAARGDLILRLVDAGIAVLIEKPSPPTLPRPTRSPGTMRRCRCSAVTPCGSRMRRNCMNASSVH